MPGPGNVCQGQLHKGMGAESKTEKLVVFIEARRVKPSNFFENQTVTEFGVFPARIWSSFGSLFPYHAFFPLCGIVMYVL